MSPVAATADLVTQRVVHVDRQAKPAILADLLRGEAVERALVFTRTKHGADKLVRSLVNGGIHAEAIHGNKSQSQRERVLGAFKLAKLRVLVATDIAARGIDVDGISHVVNYDVPNVPETYVHRIGRTARAGNSGEAISLCDAEEVPFLRAIEKLIRLSLPATDQRSGPRNPPTPADDRRKPVRDQRSRQRTGGRERHDDERGGQRHHPEARRPEPRHPEPQGAKGPLRERGGQNRRSGQGRPATFAPPRRQFHRERHRCGAGDCAGRPEPRRLPAAGNQAAP